MNSNSLIAWALLVARVAMGALFLYEGIGQIAKSWIGGDGLMRMLEAALRDNSIVPPYRYFLEHVALKHTNLLTPPVIAGELAVGIALILGLGTRLTAITALFMNANFFIMNGIVTGGAAVDAVFIVLEVALIALAGRQALSADAALAARGIEGWWLNGPDTKRVIA